MSLKFSRAILLTLVCLAFCALLLSCSPNIENDCTVYDAANLISDNDEARINEAGKSAANAKFLVLTHNGKNGSKLFGEDVLRDMGLSEDEDIVVFVITLGTSYSFPYEDEYFLNIYTYGNTYNRISNSEVDDILYGNKADLKSGRIGDALVGCIATANEAVNIPFLSITAVALMIGIVAGSIGVFTTVSKYKMRLRPTNYPLDRFAKMELTHKDDDFITSRIAVTRIQRSSSSFGGRGGGYGGGSGHRGGI
ncbi:MAG: hypothetical protein E7640_04640 [Ruminococcaceae bacterium]|nr:hypothetical protein [Oscillospiraceae bacterium]